MNKKERVVKKLKQKEKMHLQLGKHLVAAPDPGSSIVDELINDSLGRLVLVHNSSGLAHEVGPELIDDVIDLGVLAGLVEDLGDALGDGGLARGEPIDVVLERDDTLGGELADLVLALGLPLVDVGVVADAHGTAGEDDGADVVVEAGGADGLLVGLGGAGLIGEDEAGADPDGGGAHHEGGGEELAVVDTAGGDDLDGLAGEGGGLALDELDDGGDEHGGGDVTGVAAALAALGADDVDAELEALLDVLGVADHVHVDDTGLVETVDDGAGGNADGGDEELGAGLDDDVNELVELAVRVVTAGRDKRVLANRPL